MQYRNIIRRLDEDFSDVANFVRNSDESVIKKFLKLVYSGKFSEAKSLFDKYSKIQRGDQPAYWYMYS